MNALIVVIRLEAIQFALQIGGIPEQDVIEKLASDGANQALDERMRERYVGYRFDLFNIQDAQVGLPLMIVEQRVVIGTQVLGITLLGNGLVEHSAECWTVDVADLDRKTDDPPGKLIHDEEYPVGL